MSNKLKQRFFRSNQFFFSDFPFNICRMRHTADEYNDSIRCQREFWKIIYVISGYGEKIINNQKFSMTSGSLFVIHPDDRTTFNIESDYIEIYNILFMPSWLSSEMKTLTNELDFFSIFSRDYQNLSYEYRKMLYFNY